ncbi:MAG: uroporphyrinogen-III synthase [Planctomycetales bacterium]
MSATGEDVSTGLLARVRVCAFESRQGDQMRALLERQGAVVTIAPSMREFPLDQNPAAWTFAERLFAGEIDMVILLTGVGTRALAEILATRYSRQDVLDALQRTTVVVRGPKPAAVLREWKVRIDHQVPEPNTWRELLGLLDTQAPVAGKRVAVQEYGQPGPELYAGLTQRQANVLPVPVYRWALPDDLGPLQDAVRRTVAGDFDVLMFTSAQQARHVLQVAESMAGRDPWLAAARRCLIASIGPTASETLRELGIPPDVEPEHPKMGHLVLATAQSADRILKLKRTSPT